MTTPEDIARYAHEHADKLRVHFMDPRALAELEEHRISEIEYAGVVDAILSMTSDDIVESIRVYNALEDREITPVIERKMQLLYSVSRFILGVSTLPE